MNVNEGGGKFELENRITKKLKRKAYFIAFKGTLPYFIIYSLPLLVTIVIVTKQINFIDLFFSILLSLVLSCPIFLANYFKYKKILLNINEDFKTGKYNENLYFRS